MNNKLTYIDKSDISGLGLFAGEYISKGEIVWIQTKWSEIIYTEQEWEDIPDKYKHNIRKYVYKYGGNYHLNIDKDLGYF